MARRRKAVRPVKVTIKLTLCPERDADLLQAIETAPNRAQLVLDALRGRPVASKPVEIDEADELRDAIAGMLM